ncbi:MAG: hypothetical protein R2765_06095 [Ferruginibacter sp.]
MTIKNNKAKKEMKMKIIPSVLCTARTCDKYLKQKDYNNAKQHLKKAQKLRPDDQIPKIRLDEIKTKIEDEKKKNYIKTM